jgi:hypothetical protein
MMKLRFDGREFDILRASDRSGDVTLVRAIDTGPGTTALEVSFSNETQSLSLSCFEKNLPLALVEFVAHHARQFLPPGRDVGDFGPNQLPEDLLGYFAHLEQLQPNSGQWARGAGLAAQWIYLMRNRGSATQDQVDALLREIAAESEPGSGWLDLWLRARTWATSAGFSVPSPTNPWAR